MNTIEKTNTRLSYISYLRITATVCVIWLHTCSTLTDNRELFALSEAQNVFFGDYRLMYWAVPVFLMITGALLLGKEASYSKCFQYCCRVILALFVFGIPFAAMKLVAETKEFPASMIW